MKAGRIYADLRQAAVVWTTVTAWILFSASLYIFVLKERIEGAPSLGAQFFLVNGIILCVVSIVGYILFFPTCPLCFCPDFQPALHVLPMLQILVGATSFYQARMLSIRAEQVSSDVFTKIPTETELTAMDGEDELGFEEQQERDLSSS